jgi:hypothetical protein
VTKSVKIVADQHSATQLPPLAPIGQHEIVLGGQQPGLRFDNGDHDDPAGELIRLTSNQGQL